jgi:hypothetical protein
MGLTSGTGLFGHDPAGRFNFAPDPPTGSVLYFDPVPYRLRGRRSTGSTRNSGSRPGEFR